MNDTVNSVKADAGEVDSGGADGTICTAGDAANGEWKTSLRTKPTSQVRDVGLAMEMRRECQC